MRRTPSALPAVIVAAAGLLALAVWLQEVRGRSYPLSDVSEETLYVSSGALLQRLTLSYRALAADVYWIRAIQHYGGTKRKLSGAGAPPSRESSYPLLFPLLDYTTTLDPLFNIAYRFGAIFLSETHPNGPGRPDLAIALLEKGLRARPDRWQYMQDIGFVHYWWGHDYKAASEWFRRAGEVPGAPWFLRSLAANTLTLGGDRASSRRMWESIHETAEIDWLRRDAERRLTQLAALDDIDALQARVDRFVALAGQKPDGWLPLIRTGLLRAFPNDPTGTPYEIDGAGRVQLSARSTLFPLPVEPRRASPAS